MDFLFPSNKQATVKKGRTPQHLSQNAGGTEISLPKLVKCKSKFNCNLWGRDDLLGLCTECYREYDSRLHSCTKKDIVNWLLEKQGLKNLSEACKAYAKELVYPKEEIVDPKNKRRANLENSLPPKNPIRRDSRQGPFSMHVH